MTDRDDLTEAHLLDDVRNIVGIGRDRVWSRRLVALAMPAEVQGNDTMPAGEVFCLRGKERAIARRPVHKDKGGFPGATIFKASLMPLRTIAGTTVSPCLRRAAGATASRLPASGLPRFRASLTRRL